MSQAAWEKYLWMLEQGYIDANGNGAEGNVSFNFTENL
jgi:hypothetical protein